MRDPRAGAPRGSFPGPSAANLPASPMTAPFPPPHWRPLQASEAWTDVWRELHCAVRLVGRAGERFAAERPQGRHAALELRDEHPILIGALIAGKPNMRAGLDMVGLRLRLQDTEAQPVANLPLAGITASEAEAWIERELTRRVESGPRRAAHEVPLIEHPVEEGARFGGEMRAERTSLVGLYANTRDYFRRFVGAAGQSARVLCESDGFTLTAHLDLPEGQALELRLLPPSATHPSGAWSSNLAGSDTPLLELGVEEVLGLDPGDQSVALAAFLRSSADGAKSAA